MAGQQSRYPLIGAHMSIAGGVSNAVGLGRQAGCTALQIFTKASNQWNSKPYTAEEIEKFAIEQKSAGIDPVVGHTAYLINIASPKKDIYKKSVDALIDELRRSQLLGLPDLVMHPGSFLDTDEATGIRMIVDTLNEVIAETPEVNTRVALETTAGQGTNLGYKFEQLAEMIDGVTNKARVSVCLDTCHVFAAGYDIRDKRSYENTLAEFDRVIGLKYLKVVHLNDSTKGLGSRRDRHEHLGKGAIGLEAFKYIIQDQRLKEIPKLLETPKDEAGEYDKMNLDILRKFYKA